MRKRQCKAYTAFETEAEANKRIEEYGVAYSAGFKATLCPYCGKWHNVYKDEKIILHDDTRPYERQRLLLRNYHNKYC